MSGGLGRQIEDDLYFSKPQVEADDVQEIGNMIIEPTKVIIG